MIVPIVPTEPMVDKEGDRSKAWDNFFQQNQQSMQQSLSDEGFWIPSVSSAADSVRPSTIGGQLAQVATSYGTQGGVNLGTLVYDPNTNQLKVLLSDGT